MAKNYKFYNGRVLKALRRDYYGKVTAWLDVTESYNKSK
jgi:hypothetical protein